MDRYQPRSGTGLMAWEHIQWMQDSVQKALANAFGDYIEDNDSFYVHGCQLTLSDEGTGQRYTLTDGVVCLAGEFMPVVGGSVLKTPALVVYLIVVEEGVDDYPTPNLDGTNDYVMRQRHAEIRVGPLTPVGASSVSLPRKEELDMLRLKGRVVPKGSILPYGGPMSNFDATGLGLNGSLMEGWAVCNGLNGTIDMRGLTPFGATNVPSSGAGTLYDGVDGSANFGDLKGRDKIPIEPNHLPPHKHPYNDHNREASTPGSGVSTGHGLVLNTIDTTRNSHDNVTSHDPMPTKPASRALVFIQSIL